MAPEDQSDLLFRVYDARSQEVGDDDCIGSVFIRSQELADLSSSQLEFNLDSSDPGRAAKLKAGGSTLALSCRVTQLTKAAAATAKLHEAAFRKQSRDDSLENGRLALLEECAAQTRCVEEMANGVEVTKHCYGRGKPTKKLLFYAQTTPNGPSICWCEPGAWSLDKGISLKALTHLLLGKQSQSLTKKVGENYLF